MKKILSLIVLASAILTSCKKEETAEAPPIEEVAAADTTAVATDNTTAVASQAQTAQPAVNNATGSVMTANPQATAQSYTTTAAPAVTAKGMNPAHGQPGHRCDIAVGAPLNSPPGKNPPAPVKTATQSTTITPAMLQNGQLTPGAGSNVTTTTTPAPVTPVVTAPGMNPPHGQEGHDCAVAVGAPLPKKD